MTPHPGASARITFIISSFRAGGGEKQMIEIANEFAVRGHAVDLLVLKPVGNLAGKVDSTVRTISLDAGRIILSLPKLVTYLRNERPEVLLSVDEHTHVLSLLARPIARTQTRIILRIGNLLSILAEHYEGKAKVLPFLTKRLFKKADSIIANSRGVADDVIAVTGIDPARVTIIMNPKPQQEILQKAGEPVAHEWFTHKTAPIIVATGRLRVQKNFAFLIRAFAALTSKVPARLVIIGTGREEGRLRAAAEEAGCAGRVLFTGHTDNPYAYMAKADCFVASSLWEGLPNAVLEALVCGTPVVAADCSAGPREILAPDTDYRKRLAIGDGVEYASYGVLYAVNDEAALVEAMARVVTDPALRQKYAAASTKRSEAFDHHDMVSAYARVLGI